jgi:hypothetical protein
MIPTASLVTACSSRPFVQGFPSEFPRVDVIAGFFASGQPSAGRELGDPIDREVSQSRLDRAIEKIPKILLSNDWKLLAEVWAQLRAEDLAEVLKYAFCTGEAEQIVLNQLKTMTGRDFGGTSGNSQNRPIRWASKTWIVTHGAHRRRTHLRS